MVPYQVNFGENPTIVYSSVAIMNKKNHFTLDAQGWCTGMTQRDGVGKEVGGASGWGTHVNQWLIHVNGWQKPLQYCKIISLQLIKIKEK